MSDAIGAFMVCTILIALAGASGGFARVMDRIPQALAAALMAGVLTRFSFDAFLSERTALGLVRAMFASFLFGRRVWPRYAVPGVLAVGIAVALVQGRLDLGRVTWQWAVPVFPMPTFSLAACIGIALPLFVVTIASQHLPGVAVQRAAGCARRCRWRSPPPVMRHWCWRRLAATR